MSLPSPVQLKPSSSIGVIGCGYLGAVHAACVAHWGFPVVALDTDPWKLDRLRSGSAPFFEDMLDPLLREGLSASKLTFTTDPADLAHCSLVFLCVGTPQLPDSPAADLSQVEAAISTCLEHLQPGTVVIGKSTVPVGTAAELLPRLTERGLHLAWNPEFLREGTAVADTLHPERIVVGCTSDAVETALRALYQSPIAEGSVFLRTDFATSEIIKEAANAFLATKVSFINAVAALCDVAGGDVDAVATAMGLDSRIGNKFLRAGIGYGGGCFPKDVRALAHRSRELGVDVLAKMLDATDAANIDARRRAFELVQSHLPENASTVAVLGAAFKPGSDDVRDSPSVWLVEHLRSSRPDLSIQWFDPAFSAGSVLCGIEMLDSPSSALCAADLVVVATDWAQFKALDPDCCAPRCKILVDLRNCVPSERWARAGWEVHPLGRPSRLAV